MSESVADASDIPPRESRTEFLGLRPKPLGSLANYQQRVLASEKSAPVVLQIGRAMPVRKLSISRICSRMSLNGSIGSSKGKQSLAIHIGAHARLYHGFLRQINRTSQQVR